MAFRHVTLNKRLAGLSRTANNKDSLFIRSGQCLAVGNTQILTPISCKSVQLVPVRVEEPVDQVRESSSSSDGAMNPFPRCPKPAGESRPSKLDVYY